MAERIYARIVGSRVRSQLAYRTSFTLDLVSQALAQAGELVVILTIFARVHSLGGFGADQVLLLYALSGMSFGLADLAVGQLDELPRWIRTGELDVLLARPLSVFVQLVTSDVQLRRLGRVAVGVAVLVVVLARGTAPVTALTVAQVVVAVLTGTVLTSSVWVVTCSLSFWVVDGRELANAFTYGSTITTAYPITIFTPALRVAFCFVVPSAFVAYYPALAILGRPDPLGLPGWLAYVSPLVALASAGIAALVWRTAVRHYQGAGS